VTDHVWDEVAYGLTYATMLTTPSSSGLARWLDIVDLKRYRDRSPFSLALANGGAERRHHAGAEPHLLVRTNDDRPGS